MESFLEMGLPEDLTRSLQKMQFSKPTPIQAEAIPLALEGKDILGSAQTGTGKTGAFGIPLIAKLLANPTGSALVMTPTRELATQVIKQLELMLGRKSKIRSVLLIGGEPMGKQLARLRSRPRLIVGTPGRINDHLKRKSLSLDDTNFLVLDETDRMLDMGFSIQIESILKRMSPERQTLLFSATLPKNIIQIANTYLNSPVRVSVSPTSAPAANIKQDTLRLKEGDKYPNLLSQLEEREGSVIIFVKTKHGTEKMATRLSKEGYEASAIHGDLRQNKRSRVIAAFRKKKYRILVATDVAARGLDIPHIEHVINYDLPQCAEDYIHRIGRTARAGAEGAALNFVAPSDRSKWNAIDRLLNPDAKPKRESGSRNESRPSDRNRRFKRRGSKGPSRPESRGRGKRPSRTQSSDKRPSRFQSNENGSSRAQGNGKRPSRSQSNEKGPSRFQSKNKKSGSRFQTGSKGASSRFQARSPSRRRGPKKAHAGR